MTRIEKKLQKAGINMEYIINARPNEFEVFVPNSPESNSCGQADDEKTDEVASKCMDITGWAGRWTGYGSCLIAKHNASNDDGKDYCDVSSRHHY